MATASFVHDLGIVLGVATGTGILCRKFNQPSILGYLAAGLIVGPYIPIPLFADMGRVHSLSEFGVVLVMFVIGLEFQLSKLFKVLPVAGFSALIEIGTMLWLGFSIGIWLGWNKVEALFLGASICISSTMLVSKIFEERPVPKNVRTFVLGVLVLQDVAAIALIAAMSAVAESGTFSVSSLSVTLGKLTLTLAAMVALGLLIVPRLVRYVLNLKNAEASIVTAVGICFSFSLLAEELGYSVALGAFVAGLLVSESGRGHDVEHIIKPIKDVFAAIFFVSIGMTVDPLLALESIGPAALVLAGVLFFQLMSISIAGILSGNGVKQSLTAGLSLGQIGEFGFIIASLGIVAGVVRPSLQPILVTVAVVTAFTTPLALRGAPRLVDFVDRHLPARMKHLLVVYEGWFEGIRQGKTTEERSVGSKALRAIVLDTLGWIFVTAVFLFFFYDITQVLGEQLGVPAAYRILAAYGFLLLISIPPLLGIARNTHNLGEWIICEVSAHRARSATAMTPTGQSVLRSAVRVLVMMGAGIPAAAAFRPLVGSLGIGVVIVAVIVIMLAFLWKSAGRLDAEIRSEAERLVAFLDRQRSEGVNEQAPDAFFPNLENMDGIYIFEDSAGVGKTLTELNLRARSGVLVVAIHREGQDVVLPTGSERLMVDDLLFVTGTSDSVKLARKLLAEGPSAEEEDEAFSEDESSTAAEEPVN
ncbi:Cation:proton antiporter [Sulfidibacter corallicola]|uniref:Cation:proton antiporter n=1 Tax=Sulfidibacter corallicola TaxID=2818388 RepID=A0A8A4THH2_SULCO|nr:cation:proton antiporter [Sulfidibacter corallicola]QTD49376.1 cation:proton antiporter [Sulfidibacter corallicola]